MALEEITPDTRAALAKLFAYSKSHLGIVPRITSTKRSCAEQNALYAKGRTAPGGVVTNARGCISWHVLGRAVDVLLDGGSLEDYRALGAFWESLGGFWGGRIEGLDDFGHFEWHPGVSIEQLCPSPDACSAAERRSFAIQLLPRSQLWTALGVGAVVFGTWAALDYYQRRQGGYGKFRWF